MRDSSSCRWTTAVLAMSARSISTLRRPLYTQSNPESTTRRVLPVHSNLNATEVMVGHSPLIEGQLLSLLDRFHTKEFRTNTNPIALL